MNQRVVPLINILCRCNRNKERNKRLCVLRVREGAGWVGGVPNYYRFTYDVRRFETHTIERKNERKIDINYFSVLSTNLTSFNGAYLAPLALHRAGVLVDQTKRSDDDDAWGSRALAVTRKRPLPVV